MKVAARASFEGMPPESAPPPETASNRRAMAHRSAQSGVRANRSNGKGPQTNKLRRKATPTPGSHANSMYRTPSCSCEQYFSLVGMVSKSEATQRAGHHTRVGGGDPGSSIEREREREREREYIKKGRTTRNPAAYHSNTKWLMCRTHMTSNVRCNLDRTSHRSCN